MRLGDAHLLRELSQWSLAALLRDALDDVRAALGLIVADATTAMALELIQIRHGERCKVAEHLPLRVLDLCGRVDSVVDRSEHAGL